MTQNESIINYINLNIETGIVTKRNNAKYNKLLVSYELS
jgi:hypothetical protein